MANIRLNLDKLRPVAVLALQRNVIAKMTGNANFPTPVVTLANMTAKADELEIAIEDATFGSRKARLYRDAIVAEAKDMLRKQADYVRSICLGDVTMLESSGFDLAKQPSTIGVPGTPSRMEAHFTTLAGQIDLRWRSVHGAHGYQVWMTDQDPGVVANWQPIGFTTRVRHLVTDLESLKLYWFCVNAIGVAGEGAKSDPAMSRAA